jgi:hypothetical protein
VEKRVLYLKFIHIYMTDVAYPVSKFNIKHTSLYTAYLCETPFHQKRFTNKKQTFSSCFLPLFDDGFWQRATTTGEAAAGTGTKSSRDKDAKEK